MSRLLLFVLFTISWSLELPAQRTKNYRSYQKRGKKYRSSSTRKRNRRPAPIKQKAPPAKEFTQFDKSPHPHYDKFKQMSSDDQLKVLVLFMKLYGMLEGMTKYKKMYPKNKIKSKHLKTKKMKKTVKLILDLFLGADAVAQTPAVSAESKKGNNDNNTCYFAGYESYYAENSYCTKPNYINKRTSDSFFVDELKNKYDSDLSGGAGKFIKFVITDTTTGDGMWIKDSQSCDGFDEKPKSVDYILCNPDLYGSGTKGEKLCVPAGTKWSANSSAQCHAGFMKFNEDHDLLNGVVERMEANKGNFEKLVSRLFLTCFCKNKSYYHKTSIRNPPAKCQNNTDPNFNLRECTYKERTMFHSTCFGLMGQFHALNNMHSACGNENESSHQNLIKSMQGPLKEIFGTWNKSTHQSDWSDDAQENTHKSIRYKHDRAYDKYRNKLTSVINKEEYQKYYCEGGGKPPGHPGPPGSPNDGKACLCDNISDPPAEYSLKKEDLGCVPQNAEGTLVHDQATCKAALCFCSEIEDDPNDPNAKPEDRFPNCIADDKATIAPKLELLETQISHSGDACKAPNEEGPAEICECQSDEDFDSEADPAEADCLVSGKAQDYTKIKEAFETQKAEADGIQDFTAYFTENYTMLEKDSQTCNEGNNPAITDDGKFKANYSIYICFKSSDKKLIHAYIIDPTKEEEMTDLPPYNIEIKATETSSSTSEDETTSGFDESGDDDDKDDVKIELSDEDIKKLDVVLEAKFKDDYHTQEEIEAETDEDEKSELSTASENLRIEFITHLKKDETLEDFKESNLSTYTSADTPTICDPSKDKPHDTKTVTDAEKQKLAKFTATLNIQDNTATSNTLNLGTDGNNNNGINHGGVTPANGINVIDRTLYGRD
ncbi:hypothetical protein N9N67_08565 [Bacteriovoracaceae bacterium]|nr:hypothetical protein [Bacteriovoracaceae bacterium]